MTKYNAKKVVIDGIKFDSKMEADYYIHLKRLKEQGEIADFELQPKFQLQPKFEKNGTKYQAIFYKADFKVFYPDGCIEIVDVKGMTTPLFNMKAKMYHYHHDFELKLITYSRIDGGWIELDDLKKARAERKKKKMKSK